MSKKNLPSFLLMIFAFVIFSPSVHAEIKEIIGVGEHYMEDKSETVNQAKNKAKLNAELDVIEQIKFNVESYSTLHNSNLTKDEVIIITAGIIDVKDVKYTIRTDFDNVLVLKATVTANVDTDKIPELVEREVKRRHSKR